MRYISRLFDSSLSAVIVLHVIVLHDNAPHVVVLHDVVLHDIALHVVVLHDVVLHVIVLHVAVLHGVVLHVVVLHVVVLQYGRAALEIVMKSIVQLDKPLVSPPTNYKGDFMKGMACYDIWSYIKLYIANDIG